MQALVDKQPYALEILHARYHQILKAALVRIMNNESEAEDTLQEVFLQLWNRAGTYSPKKGRPLGWILTLARRRAIDRIRQNRAYENATLRFEADINATWLQTGASENAHQSSENQEFLARLLSLIPALQSQAIRSTFLEGMTQRELSQSAQIPLGTIKTRIELGLKKLAVAAGEIQAEAS
jgi:RNA polymerase sigma-70 factor (ECF subfamily)